jgi:hypothetical protein
VTQYQHWQAHLAAIAPKPRLTVTPNPVYRRNAAAQRGPTRQVRYVAAAMCVNDPQLAMVTDMSRRARVKAAREWGK